MNVSLHRGVEQDGVFTRYRSQQPSPIPPVQLLLTYCPRASLPGRDKLIGSSGLGGKGAARAPFLRSYTLTARISGAILAEVLKSDCL